MLRTSCEETGISQAALARILDVSESLIPSFFEGIEKSQSTWPVNDKDAVAHAVQAAENKFGYCISRCSPESNFLVMK